MGGGPPKHKLLCILPSPEPTSLLDALREKFPEIEIVYYEQDIDSQRRSGSHGLPASIFADVTILATLFALPKTLADAPKLEWVQLSSAGSDTIQHHPIYTDTDKITITTSTGVHGPQIAEHAIFTALLQSHHFPHYYELQKRHEWGSHKQIGPHGPAMMAMRDRVGLRLGVLGYGSIGRQIARVAAAMGMKVLAYTATPKDTPEKRRDNGYIVPGTGDLEGKFPSEWYSGLGKQELHGFLRQDIDWLVVAVPLTKDTTGLLGKEEFDVLSRKGKRPCFLTNIARGKIVKTGDLVDALKDGKVWGAALDVTDPEPLDADSELWDMKNVTITPHISGRTESYSERSFGVLETNLGRLLNGENLINVVNRKRGY